MGLRDESEVLYLLGSDLVLRAVDLLDDEEFLFQLYSSTRDDLGTLGLPQEQLVPLLRMQYAALVAGYSQKYPAATHHIIEFDGLRVGRLLVERRPGEILGIDLAVLPEFRGRGIGGSVIRWLIEEAEERGRAFVLHVARHNPALRLYRRLGGEITHDTGTHFRIEWGPMKERQLRDPDSH